MFLCFSLLLLQCRCHESKRMKIQETWRNCDTAAMITVSKLKSKLERLRTCVRMDPMELCLKALWNPSALRLVHKTICQEQKTTLPDSGAWAKSRLVNRQTDKHMLTTRKRITPPGETPDTSQVINQNADLSGECRIK